MTQSFYEIAKQYEELIYHLMSKLHIYRDKDEFFQTGMIALWEAQKKFEEGKGAFMSLAYVMVKGRMMDLLKEKKRLQERNVYPDEEFWQMHEDPLLEIPLELELLTGYCRGLTEKQRRWTILTFYNGMSTREIAAAEKVTVSAVKKWRKNALEKIRENISAVKEKERTERV